MDFQSEITVDYSSRRPKSQAWRICLAGHTTYAETRENAIELHANKLKAYGQINDILKLCAVSSSQ
jgi:hypothetical protein